MKKRSQTAKKPNPRQQNKDIELLFQTCRPGGAGPAILAIVTKPLIRLGKRIGEERVATVIADASPGHFKMMQERKFMLAEHLHVDRVIVQDSVADPLLALASRLGGRVVGFTPERKQT